MSDPTTENTETVKPAPDTLDELIERNEPLKGLPEMIPAERFNALQSADFGVLATVFDEQTRILRRKNASSVDRAYAVRAIIAYSDDFFTSISDDKDAYRKWAQGRVPLELAEAYMSLYAFYAGQLGKSKDSSNGSTSAPSN